LSLAWGHLGFAIIEHQEGQSFDNANRNARRRDICVRVYRERGIVHMELLRQPAAWVDSAVLMDHLGLSKDAVFHGSSVGGVLDGIGSFLQLQLG